MWSVVKKGWSIAWQQPFAVFVLFAYHLLWGVTLYKLIQSVALPLLHRYPGSELSKESAQLFWIEGQFQLTKTDLIVPYLWAGASLLLLRILLQPVLSAGVYHSLRHSHLNAGYRFVQGIAKHALPFLGLYIVRLLLSLAPLYWLLPFAAREFATRADYGELAQALLPALVVYAAFVALVQLVFLFLQLGRIDDRPVGFTLIFFARQLPAILLAAAIVAAAALAASTAVFAASFIWAGFFALIGIQAFRLAQMFFRVWAIGTQFALWDDRA